MGKGSTGDEREMAKNISLLSDNDPTITYEGEWSLISKKFDLMASSEPYI